MFTGLRACVDKVDSLAVKIEIFCHKRLEYLSEALSLLKTDYPEGYALIQDYFLSDDKVTLPYLASKYGLSIDKIRYRIRIAKKKIKDYIIMHENE